MERSVVIAFLIGLIGAFYLNIGPQLFVVEAFFLARFFLSFGVGFNILRNNPGIRWYAAVAGLYLLMQLVTDIIRQTPIADALRGNMSLLCLFIVPFELIRWNSASVRLAVISFLGFQAGLILKVMLIPNEVEAANIWKFGVGMPTMFFVAYYVPRMLSERVDQILPRTAFALFFLGIGSMLMNARSLGGVMIFSSVLLILVGTNPFAAAERFIRFSSPLGAFLGIFIVVSLVFVASYSVAEIGKTGVLGEEAKTKFEQQTSGVYGSAGLLLASRGDVLFAYHAITDSPIIGHGSWAKNAEYRELYWVIYDLGYMQDSEERTVGNIQDKDNIPAHSQLLAGWIWAGFFGFVFWLYMIAGMFRLLGMGVLHNHRNLPLMVCISVMALWNIFFSPFGSLHRVQWEFIIAILLSLEMMMRKDAGFVAREDR